MQAITKEKPVIAGRRQMWEEESAELQLKGGLALWTWMYQGYTA